MYSRLIFLLMIIVSVVKADIQTEIDSLSNLFDNSLDKSCESKEIELSNGVTVAITEKDRRYAWWLIPKYYYDYNESTGNLRTFNLNYTPNEDVGRILPGRLGIWSMEPVPNLQSYMQAMIGIFKENEDYKELTNEPSSVYLDENEYVFSCMYTSSNGISIVWYCYFLFRDNVGYFVFYLTTEADFIKSSIYYVSIMSMIDFNVGTTTYSGKDHRDRFNKLINFSLLQNYPNPFNNVTTINYSVGQKEKLRLEVFNMNGQLVERIFDKLHNKGYYRHQYDASNLSTGAYIYRISNGVEKTSKKMLLLR